MEKEHKQRLQHLRMKLLENISDYDNIIEGLFAESILTLAMKEKITQKKGTERLRELLDILPKRGPNAFHAFYKVLVHCGEDTAADLLCPELAAQRQLEAAKHGGRATSGVQESSQLVPSLPQDDELPEKWPDFSCFDALRMTVTEVSEGDQVMKMRFDRAREGSESVYAMHKPTRGILLVMSNEFFKEARSNGEDLSDRDGTGKDTIALSSVFEKLHFRVVIKVNLSADDMKAAVETQAGKVEATDNCFACAVLSHGDRGKVYGVDGKTVALDDLKAAVTDHCQMLMGKPKIFFIQACQGKKEDNGAAAAGGKGDTGNDPQGKTEDEDLQKLAEDFTGINIREENQSDARSVGRVSSKSDIFVAMATVPDFVSWRNTSFGTWFVQAVAYIFSHFAHKYEINQLLTRVNKLVSRAETSGGSKQVSVYNSSLTSDLYFFPGLTHGMPAAHSEIDFNNSASQTASVAPGKMTTGTQPAADTGSITAQPSDGVDGGKLVP